MSFESPDFFVATAAALQGIGVAGFFRRFLDRFYFRRIGKIVVHHSGQKRVGLVGPEYDAEFVHSEFFVSEKERLAHTGINRFRQAGICGMGMMLAGIGSTSVPEALVAGCSVSERSLAGAALEFSRATNRSAKS